MIKLNNISLDFAGNIIFKNVSLQINKFDRIGLIGNNGSGKTTFLNLLSKKNTPSNGNISHDNRLVIAHLPQELVFTLKINLKDFVVGAHSVIKDLDFRIDEINNIINTVTEKQQFLLLDELEEIQHKKNSINILNLEINAEKVLKGLGFNKADFELDINTFSGGWQMRAELARLLVLNPEILLLDEPTNHLDLPAIIWLEKFLKNTKCTVILVSHDIEFLDKNTTRIFDVNQNSVKDFKGNYSKYIVFREKEIERQIRQKKNQDKYVKQTQLLIDKFRYKKNKASFAQSLIKKLEKIDDIQIDTFDISSINFEFPPPIHCGQIIFQSKMLKKSFDDKVVFSDLSLDIYKGDRIAFVGKNGCGKTTLTKIISGELECQGIYKKGEKVIINYFAQNQNELLDPDISIIEHIERISSEKSSTQLRSLLGSFLFTGESVNKKIKVLSGGEKARLSLCASLLTPSNLIILDEPTNHLDIFAKDILKQALLQYDGTLVIVSHDRRFLSGLTDRVIEFTDNRVREFPGNIDSYLDEKGTIQDIVIKKTKKETKNNYKEKKEYDKRLRFLNKQNDKLENTITEIESEIKAFNKSLKGISKGKAVNYNDYNKLNDMLNEQLVKWEEVQSQIEKLKSN